LTVLHDQYQLLPHDEHNLVLTKVLLVPVSERTHGKCNCDATPTQTCTTLGHFVDFGLDGALVLKPSLHKIPI